MKNIILFGPPGSGKGTQASNLCDKYHFIHLSTGDLLRAEIAAQSKLGLEAKSLMDRGELVPDAVVIGIIESKLDAYPTIAGFVFDGFPRTVGQAEALDALLAQKGAPIQKVLSLKVSEEELTRRILDRGKTSGRPDDQDPEIVKNRVEEYRAKTEPLAAYYTAQDKLVEIAGEGTVDHIADLLAYEVENISEEKALPPSSEPTLPKVADKVPFPVVNKTVSPKKPAPKKEVKKAPAKEATPKKKAAPKKAAKKAAPKKAVKKAAKKAPAKKVVAKKPVKKAAAKKTVKKAGPKKKTPAKKVVAKKTVKKAVKKASPKKAAKKAVKKTTAKKTTKKVIKKAVKKAAPKKVVKKAAKKAAPKKTAKKVVKKAATKKAPAKKKGKR